MSAPFRVIFNSTGEKHNAISADVFNLAAAEHVVYHYLGQEAQIGASITVIDEPGTQGSENRMKWEYKIYSGTAPRWVKVK